MTIANIREKCKGYAARVPRDVLVLLILVLASAASFGMGFLSGKDAGEGSGTLCAAPLTAATATTGRFVASDGGTRYYLPSCAGAARISEAHKIWFVTAAAAQAAGYTPASDCPGL